MKYPGSILLNSGFKSRIKDQVILTVFRLEVFVFGIVSSRIPSLNFAAAFALSTPGGRLTVLDIDPFLISDR